METSILPVAPVASKAPKTFACRICGNESGNQVHHAREMMFGYGGLFPYLECSSCECVQIQQFPVDIAKYYPADYYSYNVRPREWGRNRLKDAARKLRDSYAVYNRGVLGRLLFACLPEYTLQSLAMANLSREARILDVGCGSGALLHGLREIGFTNLLGVDSFIASAIRYPNGLEIQKKAFFDVRGIWDLVMFHHSFEHVADPHETLRAVSRLLTPGGTCLLRVPTVSSYAWRRYRTNWVGLDAPRHFFLHSLKSIRLLAAATGLDVQEVRYDSTDFQFWGSEQYVRGIPLRSDRSYERDPSRSIFSASDIAAFRRRARELNVRKQGDSAAFYLKRQRSTDTQS